MRRRHRSLHQHHRSSITTGGVKNEINITPLVDVVLVLLIIFMVLTPILLKQLDVKVPEKSDVEITTPPTTSQIVVHVTKEGTVEINKDPIARERLAEKVRALLEPR